MLRRVVGSRTLRVIVKGGKGADVQDHNGRRQMRLSDPRPSRCVASDLEAFAISAVLYSPRSTLGRAAQHRIIMLEPIDFERDRNQRAETIIRKSATDPHNRTGQLK